MNQKHKEGCQRTCPHINLPDTDCGCPHSCGTQDNKNSWEDRFREKFIKEPLKDGGQFGWSQQDCGGAEMIIEFISEEIQKAREEERQRILGITLGMEKTYKDWRQDKHTEKWQAIGYNQALSDLKDKINL